MYSCCCCCCVYLSDYSWVLLALLLVVIVCLVTWCVLRFVGSDFSVLFSSFEHDLFLLYAPCLYCRVYRLDLPIVRTCACPQMTEWACARTYYRQSSLYTRQYRQGAYNKNKWCSKEENKTLKSDPTNRETHYVTRHTMTSNSRASSTQL